MFMRNDVIVPFGKTGVFIRDFLIYFKILVIITDPGIVFRYQPVISEIISFCQHHFKLAVHGLDI